MVEDQELAYEGIGTQNTSGAQVGSASTLISRTPTPRSRTPLPTPAANPTSNVTQLVAAPYMDQNPPPMADTSSQDVGNKRKPSKPSSNV